jgi:hypothetical protein
VLNEAGGSAGRDSGGRRALLEHVEGADCVEGDHDLAAALEERADGPGRPHERRDVDDGDAPRVLFIARVVDARRGLIDKVARASGGRCAGLLARRVGSGRVRRWVDGRRSRRTRRGTRREEVGVSARRPAAGQAVVRQTWRARAQPSAGQRGKGGGAGHRGALGPRTARPGGCHRGAELIAVEADCVDLGLEVGDLVLEIGRREGL